MLDLTSIKKPTLTVKVNENITVDVLPPSKNLLDRFVNLPKRDTEALKRVLAEMLSNNTSGTEVGADVVDELDFWQIKVLVEEYSKFVKGMNNDPN